MEGVEEKEKWRIIKPCPEVSGGEGEGEERDTE